MNTLFQPIALLNLSERRGFTALNLLALRNSLDFMRVATAHLALLVYLLGGLVVPALHDCANHQGAGQQGAGQQANDVEQRVPRSCAGHSHAAKVTGAGSDYHSGGNDDCVVASPHTRVGVARAQGGDQRGEWCSGQAPHSDSAHPCLACVFNTFDESATVSSSQQVIARELSILTPLAVSRLTPGPSTLSISPRGPPASPVACLS